MPASPSAPHSPGMRASIYLLRLDWHLEGVVSTSESKRILRTLREDIVADPRPKRAVLDDLGTPRALALRYGEGGRTRPLWSIGVLTAVSALVTYWIFFGTFTGGMLAAVDSGAPMSADANFLFVPVMAFSNDHGVGIGWSDGSAWLVMPAVIATVALLVGARTWRLVRRDDVPA